MKEITSISPLVSGMSESTSALKVRLFFVPIATSRHCEQTKNIKAGIPPPKSG
ncbi:MAG: hypothetical protein RR996_06235 [Alistipes sp.]